MNKFSQSPCCDGMRHLLQESGERGFFASFEPMETGVQTFLLHRAVATRDESKLPRSDVAISLVARLPIRFCPFCATKLPTLP